MRLLLSDGKRVLIKQPHHSISGSCLKNDISFYFQSDAVGRKCAAPGSLNFPKNIAFFHWPLDKLIFLTNKKICIHFSVHEVVCFNWNMQMNVQPTSCTVKKISTVVLPCFWGKHVVMHKIKIHLLKMQNRRKIQKTHILKNSSKWSDFLCRIWQQHKKNQIPSPQHSFSLSFWFYFRVVHVLKRSWKVSLLRWAPGGLGKCGN